MAASEIPAHEVAERLEAGDGDLYLLDVRRTDDYEEWRVEGTDMHVDVYDELLDHRFEGLDAVVDDLPDDREIVTVCVAGVTSARAADYLRERGYDARSMSDGMRGWGRVYRAYDTAVDGVVQFVRPGTGCVSHLVHDGGPTSDASGLSSDERSESDGGEAVLVDPGMHVDTYREYAAERDLEIVGAVDTHAHADHVSGGPRVARVLGVPYYLHEADSGSLDDYEPIADGDAIAVGDRALDVVHTPGHTPGSVSLRFGDGLLSGDTLFLRSVGRPDLESGARSAPDQASGRSPRADDDEEAIREAARDLHESLSRLRALPGDTVVLPGHFSDETERPLETTVGDLEAENDLFAEDDREAFVETVLDGLSETPANYQRIKRINWGQEAPEEDVADLELGPNNCAAN